MQGGISRAASPQGRLYISGTWYPTVRVLAAAGSAPGAGSLRVVPFLVERAVTISDLAANVTTLHAANTFQLAIYASSPTTGLPTGNALAVTGDISTAATGLISADITGADVTLQPGLYWAAVNNSGSTAAFTTPSASGDNYVNFMIGRATLSQMGNNTTNLSVAQTYGTWPDLTSASWTQQASNSGVIVYFKAK